MLLAQNTAAPSEHADQTLTPKDREMLAWYLGNRVEPLHLTREDLEPAYLEAWAASPRIARQIAAFRSLNTLADEFINTGARIDAMKAVSEDLRAASTSAERLRAVNAYIRLSSATSRARHRTGEAPRPPRDPEPPSRRPFVLPPLPPLPQFGRPTSPQHNNGSNPSATASSHSGPNPGIAIPGFVEPSNSDDHRAQQTSTEPTTARSPTSAAHINSSPASTDPSSSSNSPSSSPSSSRSAHTTELSAPTHFIPSSPSSSPSSPSSSRTLDRRPTETSGAAPAGAWP